MRQLSLLLGAASALAFAAAANAQAITIATVNNGDMIRMQGLTSEFNAAHPDITVNWVTLEENILRERVTTDIATGGGQYDVMTIGNYEVPIWGKQGWLTPLEFGAAYDVDDLLPAIRGGLTVDGKLYAAPFYGESAMIMYRTDLFEAAGLTMPENPDWTFIADAARKITDRANDINGICLRGKAGWGENMAFLTALNNSFGGKWFDESWAPQFDQPAWKEALQFYADLMKDAGPAGASSNGFNENLTLFQQGKCGDVDRRHRRRLLRHRPRRLRPSPTRSASRSSRTRQASRTTATGSGRGTWRSRPPRRTPRRPRPSSSGRPPRTTPRSSPRRRAGPPRLRAPAPRSTRTPTTRPPRPSPARRWPR